MSANERRRALHAVLFASATAITVYVILDMDHPRGMNDKTHAVDGPLDRGLVVKSGRDRLNRQGREGSAAHTLPGRAGGVLSLAGPHQHPHALIAVDQQPDDVVANQSRGSRDQAASGRIRRRMRAH